MEWLLETKCIMSCKYSITHYSLQEFDDYGIDFTGPVVLDGDGTVSVHEIDDVLSSAQKIILQQQLDSIDSSSHEGLVTRFAITKVFIHEAQNNV